MMNRSLAVITGASAGMGAEFARQLAAQGHDLLLIARRAERLEQVTGPIQAIHNIHCEILAADLTHPADLAGIEQRLAATPALALLVNNAGFGTLGKFWNNAIESQDRMHRLHVIAPMRLCHAALPGFVERNRGGIVNVSSVSGFIAGPGSVSYSATKAWMNRFTEGLFLELQSSRSSVKVQALCPGYTRTEFHDSLAMDTGKIPGWMWLSAERVVRESLDGLSQGKLFVIPGRRYRWLIRAYSLLPAGSRRSLSIWGARRRQSKT